MSIQDKEQYLSTTKELIKQGINNLGEDLTSQSTFRSYKTGLDNIYDDIPKVTAEGTELTIQNTRKGRMELTLKGNTSQVSTIGKNLFDKDNYNYLNVFISSEGVLSYNKNNVSIYIPCIANTTYTVSRVQPTEGNDKFGVAYTSTTPTNNMQSEGFSRNETANSITITTNANANYLVVWCWVSDFSVTLEQMLSTIQIEQNSTATDYEPYTGGIPSPNPNYPQPIHKVTGNNTISIGSNNHSINLGNDEYYNINDFADEIFKNIPTNSHYDNMLIEGAWYKYSNNKKKIFNGSEDWNYTSGVFLLSNITDYKLSTTNICLCSHYKTQNCVTATSQINDKCATFRNDSTTRRFYIKDSSFSNLEDFKASLNSNNVTLIYRLDTPTITQITDETLISQLEAIYNAMSTTGTTTISQTNADLPFIISASALKSYPNGSINITENENNIDVSLYNNANVNVQPTLQSKQVTITEDGTITITPDSGYDGISSIEITVTTS